MLCGIPCRLGPQEIVDVIHAKGFSDAYDLIFVPPPPNSGRRSGRSRARNIGYAFINLMTPELATAFALAFNKFAFPNNYSKKLCSTVLAHRQGFAANVKALDNHFGLENRAFLICRALGPP